ncbi:MAG: LEPR-XLL domain-containing protein, partial [Gammaproteobacteria bacterium]
MQSRSRPRKLQFEPLEPRLLLSADLAFAADPGGSDLTLRLDNIDGVDTVVLVDNEIADPLAQVVASQALADTSAVVIAGNTGADRLEVDQSNPFIVPIRFEDTNAGDGDTLELTGALSGSWLLSGSNAGDAGDVGFSGIERLTGGGGDTLAGSDADNTWLITADGAGSVGGLSFSGFESLVGGSGADDFVFTGGSTTSIDGGGGGDSLDLSADTVGVTVDLDAGTADYAGFINDIESVTTGSGDDIVIGALNPVALDTGTGNDTLDYSLQSSPLTLDISSGSLLGIESILGGSGDDTLFGPAVDTNWNITGADSGSVAGISFDSFENLVGQAGNQDVFSFSGTGSISGTIDGGSAGFDSLVITDGNFDTVTFTPSGPDSGTIDLDGNVISYVGLEPVDTSGASMATVNLMGTASNNTATLTNSGGNFIFDAPGIESHTFQAPTSELNIDL